MNHLEFHINGSSIIFTSDETEKAIRCYMNRRSETFIDKYHYLSYFLDPRYIKQFNELDEEQIISTLDKLEDYGTVMDEITCADDKF